MNAKLIKVQHNANTLPYSYKGEVGYYIYKSPDVKLQFQCWDNKTGSEFSLEMDGTGIPILDCDCDYEIEIKIKSIPRSIPKEYIIK